MNIKKIIILSACMQQAYAGMALPEESKSTTKSLKNNIFASVSKNPVPSAHPTQPVLDLTSVVKNSEQPKAIISTESKTIPKITQPKLKPSAPVSKIQDNEPGTIEPKTLQIESPKSEPSVAEKSTLEKLTPEEPIVEQQEPGVLYQTKAYVDDQPASVVFNFEEASLSNLLSYMEAVHNIKFIPDDIVSTAKDNKGITGHKITFRTNRTLTRKESWDLCVTFLHIAGFDIIPMIQTGFYRLVSLTKANNEPIPTYIGVDSEILPDNDMIVRYVYFVRNIDPSKIQPILNKMQSGSAKLDVYAELKGLIFTDRSSSIKSLMKIVIELDRAALPEVLSVIKLQKTNAKDVIDLYTSLKPTGAAGAQPQRVWASSKKEASLDYFPQDVIMVEDKRTNSLILLGTAKDVARIEEFITKHVDVPIDRDAPPIFTYRLQYTNAKDMATTLSTIAGYGKSTDAGKYGGVRDGLKYFQTMNIVPDSWSNSLIINATAEDFEALKPLIKELDVPQKQVGLEVLFVQVTDVDSKTLGAQISGPNGQGSQVTGAGQFGPTFLQGVSAQTSGVAPGTPIVVTRGATAGVGEDFSIKSSLASLLGSNILNEAGSLLVTFGQPIWAVFKVLKSITSTHVVSNPFIVVSNNSTASITNGEERRQTSGQVISSSAVKATGLVPIQATLTVSITPQINKDNIVNLNISVKNEQFVASINNAQGDPRSLKQIVTQASVANGETLVLGGIMSENTSSSSSGVPFLENIPILGWFFKSKARKITRDHFLIFICPRILEVGIPGSHVDQYTNYKLHEAQENIDLIDESDWFNAKDPIHSAFFGDKHYTRALQEFRTGNEFADREAIDGKINKKITARKKRQVRDKERKKKKKEKQHNESIPAINNSARPARTKNSISKGVANVS